MDSLTPMDFGPISFYVGLATYVVLAILAMWGTYCVIFLLRRIRSLQFTTEHEQDDFLDEAAELYRAGKFAELESMCEDDTRAVVQLVLVAAKNHHLSLDKLQELLIHRYQQDAASELEHRNVWIQTIIKAAPMVGLFGTVVGMMGAFSKLSAATQVSSDKLAADIMLALITTACGLSIAIPLVLATATLSIRTAKLDDFVTAAIAKIGAFFPSVCSK